MGDRVEFTDGNGVRWTVTEEGADDLLAGAAEAPVTWLSFETELEIRRLWSYPDDWRRLSRPQLEGLLRRASTVVARFPRDATRGPSPHTPHTPPKRER